LTERALDSVWDRTGIAEQDPVEKFGAVRDQARAMTEHRIRRSCSGHRSRSHHLDTVTAVLSGADENPPPPNAGLADVRLALSQQPLPRDEVAVRAARPE